MSRSTLMIMSALALLCAGRITAMAQGDPSGPPPPLDVLTVMPEPNGATSAAPAAAEAAIGGTTTLPKIRMSSAIPREARRGATEAQVKADKAAFAAAAADPEAAFAAQAAALTAMAAAAAAAGVAPPPEAAALTSDPAKARATFLESLKEIAALNAASGPTLAYGITPFTHLTDEEFRRLFLSGVRQGNDPQAAMGEPANATAQAAGAAGAAAPAGVVRPAGDFDCVRATSWSASGLAGIRPATNLDWRTTNPKLVTSVKDQNPCGSCVLMSNAAAIEAAIIRKYYRSGWTSANTDISEQEYMECTPGDLCSTGATSAAFMVRAMCKGIMLESQCRWRAVDTNRCPAGTRYRPEIKGYVFVPPNMSDLKRALAYHVTVVCIEALGALKNYKSGIFVCNSAFSGRTNHCVALVAFTYNNRNEIWKVWTIKNSWGARWGEQGFFRMRADCPSPGIMGLYGHYQNVVPILS